MTKAQIRKLETIIVKMEILQSEVNDRTATLSQAKHRLIELLRQWERGE